MAHDRVDKVSKFAEFFIPLSVVSPAFVIAFATVGTIVHLGTDEQTIYAQAILITFLFHFTGLVYVRRSKCLQAYLDREIRDIIFNGSIVWNTIALTNALLRLLPNTKQPSHIEFWWMSLLALMIAATLLIAGIPLIRKYYGLPPQNRTLPTSSPS